MTGGLGCDLHRGVARLDILPPEVFVRAGDFSRRHTRHRHARFDRFNHYGASGDAGSLADLYVAEDFAASRQQCATADFGVPVATVAAIPAEGDILVDGHVVFNDSGLAHHHCVGVVDHDALADACGGMDVDTENLGDATLQKECQRVALAQPAPVAYAPGLQSLKALVEQQRVGIVTAGRVALTHGFEVGQHLHFECGVVEYGLAEDAYHGDGGHGGAVELAGQDVAEGATETFVVEERAVEEAGQGGLCFRAQLCLCADGFPDLAGTDGRIAFLRHGVGRIAT